eukprot:g6451.t1
MHLLKENLLFFLCCLLPLPSPSWSKKPKGYAAELRISEGAMPYLLEPDKFTGQTVARYNKAIFEDKGKKWDPYTPQEKNCCEICPFKFGVDLSELELSATLHRATLENFKSWYVKKHPEKAKHVEKMLQPFQFRHGQKKTSSPSSRKILSKGDDGEAKYDQKLETWYCPVDYVVPTPKNKKSVCCTLCPRESYPERSFDYTTVYEMPRSRPFSATEEQAADETTSQEGKQGDPNKPRCPVSASSMAVSRKKCCHLCPREFIPDTTPVKGNKIEADMLPPRADENGYIYDAQFLETEVQIKNWRKKGNGNSSGTHPTIAYQSFRRRAAVQQLHRLPFTEVNHQKHDSKEDFDLFLALDSHLERLETGNREEVKTNVQSQARMILNLQTGEWHMFGEKDQCCLMCSSDMYAAGPGDAPFGEPTNVDKRIKGRGEPLGLPYRAFNNGRQDYTKKGGGTMPLVESGMQYQFPQ